MTKFTLSDLEAIIAVRAQESARDSAQGGAKSSYTRKLLDRGVAHCAKKFGEEAVETVIAAVGEDNAHFTAECADTIYHLLVLLKARGVPLAEVEAVLQARTKMSGLEEKASRAPVTS